MLCGLETPMPDTTTAQVQIAQRILWSLHTYSNAMRNLVRGNERIYEQETYITNWAGATFDGDFKPGKFTPAYTLECAEFVLGWGGVRYRITVDKETPDDDGQATN